MKKKRVKKTFRYTVCFTVETDRELDPLDLEERVAAVWDDAAEKHRLFVDSYGFDIAMA